MVPQEKGGWFSAELQPLTHAFSHGNYCALLYSSIASCTLPSLSLIILKRGGFKWQDLITNFYSSTKDNFKQNGPLLFNWQVHSSKHRKGPAVLPATAFTVSLQISTQQKRQIMSYSLLWKWFDLADPERVMGTLHASTEHTMGTAPLI
jgi:hypothetical protein